MNIEFLGLGCRAVPVTGALQVTGTWTANSNGSYADRTTTTGSATFPLDESCMSVAGTLVACSRVGSIFMGLGWTTSTCATDASGTCRCALTAKQSGGLGVVSPWASDSGTYTTSGGALNIDDSVDYSYCVSGNTLTVTPKPTILPVTGTVVLQRGGAIGSGGAGGAGGSAGSGGSTTPSSLPCDSYAADGGPCVAAHSTVRRLSSSYAGPLYQVRVGGSKSGTGGAAADIGVLPDGFADSVAQDTACGDSPCTISIIYDQSGRGNHLTVAPAGGAKRTPDNEADAKSNPITIGGHKAYGLRITPGVGYRNNRAVGTAIGDEPETIYMVASGEFYNAACCFDYGNAETNSMDNGEGAAEAVYFGNCTIWNKGAGDGPWVMADLENGLWAGDTRVYEENTSVSYKLVTGMVKGDSMSTTYPDGHWSIKVGNAQSGGLEARFDGPRPNNRYNPMKKEGAIILGTAGDNSNADQGVFFEGVMTAHYSSNAADDAVQAGIVAAYGQ